MNQLTQQFPDMPENFDPVVFKTKLASMNQTIADMISGDHLDIMYDFFPKVLDALITHEKFNTWDNDTRINIVQKWSNVRFIMEQITEVFTEELCESSSGISSFINSLVIPHLQNQ